MIVNKSMFPLQTGFGVISKMQDRFATLQMQLGTGMKSQTLSGLGRDLPLSLSVRSRLSSIEGYKANIETANLRLSFLDNAMTRFDKIEAEARSSAVQGQYGTNGINMATLPGLSKARLDEMVTLLNSEIAGRYLFGGNKTDQKPIPDTSVLLNGQGGRAGFETVVSERKAADLGTERRGRLESRHLDPTDPTVHLTEDGVHPFGMKVSTISSHSGGVNVEQPHDAGGTNGRQVSITFSDPASRVQSGDTITIGLTMPDGTESQIKMRAVSEEESSGSPDEFVIGDLPEDTAANFDVALKKKLEEVGRGELAAASTFAAAQNFFNGAGEHVLRVAGTDPYAADTLRVGTATDTIMWYSGQATAEGNPRQSVTAQIDETARINYGMQATESGFLRLMRTMASMAVETYVSEDGDAKARFDGMAMRLQAEMSEGHNSEAGSIEIMTMELGVARSHIESATKRHTNYSSQLLDLLSDIETVSKEDVAMEILALQTRLQASYQVTSMVSQLSLINFMR